MRCTTGQKNKRNGKKGATLAELVVTVAIIGLFAGVMGAFGRDIFSFNSFVQSDLQAQMEGRRAITTMVSEMREMTQSGLGAYPIAAAATSSVTFFSDIDADDVAEQVRYYVQGNKIMKSVVNPTGNPLTYNQGSAILSTVVSDAGNGTSTPLFEYYDTNYAGTTTPLTVPINVASVKLIKMNLVLNRKNSRQTPAVTITSQVTLRNLKDNL